MPEGLVSRAQQPAQNMPTAGTEDGDDPNTTPEEDQAHESAMAMVAELLYSNDKSHEALMNILQPDNPAESVAEASMFLISKVEETFKGNYPEALVLPTADEISDLVLELADASGKFKVTEQIAVKAKSLVVKQLMEAYGVDENEFQAATQDVTTEDMNSYDQLIGGANA